MANLRRRERQMQAAIDLPANEARAALEQAADALRTAAAAIEQLRGLLPIDADRTVTAPPAYAPHPSRTRTAREMHSDCASTTAEPRLDRAQTEDE